MAISDLFVAINGAEAFTPEVRATYFNSANFGALVTKAEFTDLTYDGTRTDGVVDKLWSKCIKALGLNEEALRRQRFHARQEAARKSAGIAARTRKTVTETEKEFLFCSVKAEYSFGTHRYLPADRTAFWLQKWIRQTCWVAAFDLVHDYSGDKQSYLISVLARANAATNAKALDTGENTLEGTQLTNGIIGLRKQFWKFVDYHLTGITPKDLGVIIDIHKAIDRETHNTDRVAVTAV